MKIGQLAKLTGISTSRIRFYESAGLLLNVARRANGYREYPPETAALLEIIDSAQRAGFSLEQIRHLLPLGNGSWNHDELEVALKSKVAEIESIQARMKRIKSQLLVALKSMQNRPEGISCDENRMRVLELLRKDGLVSPGRKKTASRK